MQSSNTKPVTLHDGQEAQGNGHGQGGNHPAYNCTPSLEIAHFDWSGWHAECLVDEVSFKDRPKPSRLEIAAIRSRLGNPSARVTLDIHGLEQAIRCGYTILPALLVGGTRLDDWVSQSIWMLDFDNEGTFLDPLDALERAYELELDPLFLYFSHSSTIDPYLPRYHLVLGTAEPVVDRMIAEKLGEALLRIYPEADQRSCERNRMFLSPGKEVLVCWNQGE